MVAGDAGVDEEVLDFFRGGSGEGDEAVAGAAGADGEDGGELVGGEGFAGGVAAGIDGEFGVDFGEGEDGVFAPVPVAFGKGGRGVFEAQAGVVEDEDGAVGEGDGPGRGGWLGEGLAEAVEVGVAEGDVLPGLGFEPAAEGAGQEGGGEVLPVVAGHVGMEGGGGLGFEIFGVVVQGGEGAVESGVAGEDVPEEGEEAVADGVAAVGGIGVGVVLAPVVDALAAEVVAEFGGGEGEEGAEDEDAADGAPGAEGGEAAGVGSAGEAEEEGFEGVVGVVAEGDGVAGGGDFAPLFEASPAGGGFGAFAGVPVLGDMEVVAGEGDGAAGAEGFAPGGVGVGVGSAQAVVEVVGGEGEFEFAEEEEEGGAVGAAAEADQEAPHAVEQMLFGDEFGKTLGGWAEGWHGRFWCYSGSGDGRECSQPGGETPKMTEFAGLSGWKRRKTDGELCDMDLAPYSSVIV